ncbi:MAG: class I mannose-6-phosphate isomerase [Planctomycetes bacterium]|nr:class I mannose-6-phosphate isomerase [Planctomycetota bacterium]
MNVYPLIFEPILKPRLWGGRRLESLLGKHLPAGERVGESWELADLEQAQSRVVNGPAQGRSLGELVREWGPELLGGASLLEGRFPLLLKYLDAAETLSVQVHPDEAAARRLGGGVRVKHEAWYVIAAEPDRCIFHGLRPGVDRDALRQAVQQRRLEEALVRVPARKGHAFYLPAGTVHALGAGVTVAEVQTPSDVTYRLYDWDRVDPASGAPRELHLEDALACVSFDAAPPPQQPPAQHIASVWTTVTELIRCPSFAVDRVRMVEGAEQELAVAGPVAWMLLEGRCSIVCAGYDQEFVFRRGDSVLIPAGIRQARVCTHEPCMWLEITLPHPSPLSEFEHPAREGVPTPSQTTSRPVPLRLHGRPAAANGENAQP